MTSRIITAVDISDLPVAPLAPESARTAQRQAEADLLALMRRDVRREEHDRVHDGDVVKLTLRSRSPRWDRGEVGVVVGRGHFDHELERALVGAPVGVTTTVELDEASATAFVSEAFARVAPEPTDDRVAALTGGEFASVAEYLRSRRRAELARLSDEHASRAASELYEELERRTEAAIDPADVDVLVQAEVDRCRALAAEEGLVFEEMTAEQLLPRAAVHTFDEFVARGRRFASRSLVNALYACRLTGESLGEVGPDRVNALATRTWNAVTAHVRTTMAARDASAAHEEGA